MRITQVVNHYSPCIGGMERVVEDISNILTEHGHEVKVICLDKCANSKKKLFAKEKIGKIFVERIPFLDLKYYKIGFGVLGKIKDADIVHVHGIGFFSDFLLLTKWIHKKPVVVSTHGGIFHTPSLGLVKKIYFSFFEKIVLGLADKIIAVSKNDLELFLKISNNVILVENGVNLERFKSGKKKKNSFIFVGRFSSNKKIKLLFETFAEIKKSKKDFSLIIAGTDWENLFLEFKEKVNLLSLEENISFILNPSQEEIAQLYTSSEFFVSASQYEGFGLTLVEAMASGCIPIVQRNNGFEKILKDKTDFFADFTDKKSSAKKIVNIMQKNNLNIAKSVVDEAKKFKWKNKITLLETIYSETSMNEPKIV
ncbi:MAG: glycosyltransferase family 4 protein [archaeon]|nr:glycosyltransferase family 4 protein [archaeon]